MSSYHQVLPHILRSIAGEKVSATALPTTKGAFFEETFDTIDHNIAEEEELVSRIIRQHQQSFCSRIAHLSKDKARFGYSEFQVGRWDQLHTLPSICRCRPFRVRFNSPNSRFCLLVPNRVHLPPSSPKSSLDSGRDRSVDF